MLARVEHARPDAVIMLLVGADAVSFNRAFAAAGLDAALPAAEHADRREHAAGQRRRRAPGTARAAAYFETLVTPENLDFHGRYTSSSARIRRPLNSLGESCYEGILLLSTLAQRAGSLDVARMTETAESLSYIGPRGEVRMHERHLDQRIYLAEADELRFDVIAQI